MAKILLVEDDNNLREIYEARMLAEGYTVVTASDGEAALAVAAKEKPDLIISDVMMPKISGFEMLDILRNTEGLQETKVIMLTALGQAEDKTRADSLGADKYLVKSQVTLEDIVNTARTLLGADDTTATAAAQPAAPVNPAPATPAPVGTPTPQPVTAVPTQAAPTAQPALNTPAPAPAADAATPITPAPATASEPSAETQPAPVIPVATPPAPQAAAPVADAPAAAQPAAPVNPAPTPTPSVNNQPNPAQPVSAAPAPAPPAPAVVPPAAQPSEPAAGTPPAPAAPATTPEPTTTDTPAATPTPPAVQPAPEPAAATSVPAPTPVDAAAIDDKVVSHAVEQLLANADQAFAESQKPAATPTPKPTVEKPAPGPTPVVNDVSRPTLKEPSQNVTSIKGDQVEVAGKKVIAPISQPDTKPSLDELLAKENAAGKTEQPAVDKAPAFTPPQPGVSVAPQSQSKDGFDPNSISL